LPKPILDMFSKSSQDLELYSIVTYHKGMLFSFENEESEGTKRMFFLIGYWIDALIHGKVLVVDEIDIKLHPLLIHFLIKLFHDSNSNTKRSQLIFTTHNTSILDLNIFRRDQIWFTERRSEELSTDIYSLAEYSPRKDQDIEKRYFTGKYGGLPFIGDGLIL
jgi:Predicted ATPases